MPKKKKPIKKENPTVSNNITGCVFKGVEFDAGTVEVIRITAQSLLNLTELFKAGNVNIESMLKIVEKDVVSHK